MSKKRRRATAPDDPHENSILDDWCEEHAVPRRFFDVFIPPPHACDERLRDIVIAAKELDPEQRGLLHDDWAPTSDEESDKKWHRDPEREVVLPDLLLAGRDWRGSDGTLLVQREVEERGKWTAEHEALLKRPRVLTANTPLELVQHIDRFLAEIGESYPSQADVLTERMLWKYVVDAEHAIRCLRTHNSSLPPCPLLSMQAPDGFSDRLAILKVLGDWAAKAAESSDDAPRHPQQIAETKGNRLVSLGQIANALQTTRGLKKRTLERMKQKGIIPAPFETTGKCHRWHLKVIREVILDKLSIDLYDYAEEIFQTEHQTKALVDKTMSRKR